MTRKHCMAFIFFGVLMFSFSTPLSADDYFPLIVGARWEYSMEIKQNGAEMTRVLEERCVGKKMINGKSYFEVVKGVPGVPFKQITGYLRKGEDGVYGIDGRYPDSPEQLLLKLPLTAGTTWVNETPSGKRTTYRVVGTETVSVNGKYYHNCIKVHGKQKTRNREYDGYAYYAPGVGQIKVEKTRRNDPSAMMIMELVTFEK